MKNTILSLAAFILFLLIAWNDGAKEPADRAEPVEGAVLQSAELLEETKQILQAAGRDEVEVFDLQMNGMEPDRIRMWVERFENGAKQENVTDFSTMSSEGDIQRLLLSYDVRNNAESQERTLLVSSAVMDSSGFSRFETETMLPEFSGGRLKGKVNSPRELQLNQPATMLVILEDDGNGISFRPKDYIHYDETGALPEELLRYDRVILFRMMLVKE